MPPERRVAIDLSKIKTISLELPDIIGVKKTYSFDENDVYIDAVPLKYYPATTEYPVCPHCHSNENVSVSEKYVRIIHDVQYWGARCTLRLESRYFFCSECRKKFATPFESIEGRAGVTKRLAKKLQTKSVDLVPFLYLADEFGIDDKTVHNVVAPYLKEQMANLKVNLPTVIGMDEDHLHVLTGQKKDMCFVLTNPVTVEILDILESRKKETLEKYFSQFPLEKRLEVKAVTMDMWQVYRDVAYKYFPNAKVVADRFHVQKNVNKAMNDTRKIIFKKIKQEAEEDPIKKQKILETAINFKTLRILMLKNLESLNDDQYQDLMNWLSDYNELFIAYNLKEIWRNKIYKAKSRKEAIAEYEAWKERIPEEETFDPFRELVVNSVDNWYSEVFNYFDFDGALTNNPTESLNQIIKRNMRIGNGYSFEMLRAKAILGSQKRKKLRQEKQALLFEREEEEYLKELQDAEEEYMIASITAEPDEIDEFIEKETEKRKKANKKGKN